MVICLERAADLHMPSWCHCHSLSLASVKSRLVLPFWYRPTVVVLEKGPLNGCVLLTYKNTHHYTGNFPAGFASNQTSFSCFGLAQERECGTACCYNSGLSSRSSQILQAVQTCKKQICHSIWPISQPRREARSRWPARLVTYRDGIPTQTRSPIPVRTVTDVGWLHSCDKWRHRYAKPSPVVSTGNKAEWVKVLSHSKHAVLGPLALILLQIYCRSIDGRILKISQQLAMLKVKSGQLIQTTTLDFCSRSPL